ncbi:MAG: DotI/IcmL/TraM family protein, partial [Azospirillum sp.]|nr:DotI/IcmL/TraM family protein [Azospirillum sp.]
MTNPVTASQDGHNAFLRPVVLQADLHALAARGHFASKRATRRFGAYIRCETPEMRMGANHNERLAYMRDRNLVFGRMRDRLAKSALYAWGAVLVMAFVNGGLAWKLADRPREYFGIDANGSLVPMLPLSEPSVSLTAILNFAVEGVTRAHTYSPLVWRRERQENARWFTPEGWAAFSRQLDLTGPDNQKIGLQALVERGVVV